MRNSLRHRFYATHNYAALRNTTTHAPYNTLEEITMKKELSVIQAVTNVGQSILSMVSTAKSLNGIRKQDAIILQENLSILRHKCRQMGIGELTRVSIDEMDKTLQTIRLKQYDGEMLDMAMGMLKLQYQMLYRNLQNYQHG